MTQAVPFTDFVAKPSALGALRVHLNGGVLRRAVIAAAIIGSLLTVATQSQAWFGSAALQWLPLLLAYVTPVVVVTLSQVLGARQAVTDRQRRAIQGAAAESFARTIVGHGIPGRAVLMGLAAASATAAIVTATGWAAHGGPGPLPTALLARAFILPAIFGVLSQAIAYRRAMMAMGGGGTES